MSVKFCF